MAMKKSKGLGRGLDALLGGSSDIAEAVPSVPGAPSALHVTQMQAGKYQPRTRMD
ncbi:MAG: ParB/RepB/Spo0J family partition protein, partial [Noviherbaspirillum sp.]